MQTTDGPKIDKKLVIDSWKRDGYILLESSENVPEIMQILKEQGVFAASMFFGYDNGGVLIQQIV